MNPMVVPQLFRHSCLFRYQHTATSRTEYTLHRVLKCFNMRYYESYVTGMYLVGLCIMRFELQCISLNESANINDFKENLLTFTKSTTPSK